MLWERLEGKNWCQHRAIDVTFHRGMTAILGPNGSGKSNLLGLASWLLTGENPNAGVKDDNICQLAPTTERAYGTLTFSHLGYQYAVSRYLKPARTRATLTKNGQTLAEGDANVTAAIMQELQLDAKFIPRFIVVPQSDIHAFLDARASEVDKFFQRLFDTTAAAIALKNLDAHLSGVVWTPVDGLEQLQTNISQNVARQAAIRQELLQLQQFRDTTTPEEDYAAVAAANRVAELTLLQTPLNAEYVAAEQVAAAKSAELQQQQENQRVLQAAIAAERPQVDQARAALASWAAYKQLQEQRKRLDAFILQEEQDAALRCRPTLPPDYVPSDQRPSNDVMRQRQQAVWTDEQFIAGYTPEKLQSMQQRPVIRPERPEDCVAEADLLSAAGQVTQLERQLAADALLIDQFEVQGVAACPTCQTPARSLAPYIASLKADLPARQSQATAAKQRFERSSAYHRQLAAFNQWYGEHQAALTRLEQQRQVADALPAKQVAYQQLVTQLTNSANYDVQLDNFTKWEAVHRPRYEQLLAQRRELETSTAMPTGDEGALHALIAGHNSYHEALQELEPTLAGLSATAAEALQKVHTLRGRLQALSAELLQLGPNTQAASAAAQQRIAQRTERASQISQLNVELAGLTGGLPGMQRELEIKRGQQREMSIKQGWHMRMESRRALLAAAPRFVAQHNLQRLEHGTNEILAVLQSDFRVTADSGLSFTARFRDGVVTPAGRLSGGQKVALALAFRVAVNSMFASAVGLLALDEPTASLDKTRVRALSPVFARLRELTAARGLQCIIVTHEDDLAPLFDAQIRL